VPQHIDLVELVEKIMLIAIADGKVLIQLAYEVLEVDVL